jgi:hypothetical protein
VQTIILECDAIRLVPLSVSDIGLVKSLQTNCCGNGCLEGHETCKSVVAEQFVQSALKTQEELGVSRWKVETTEGKFLGWAGFAPLAETSEISLSYCLPTEDGSVSDVPGRLCKELTVWFFKETYFSHLVAVVRVDNCAMREVILDAGFYHRESKVIEGMQADLFQMLSPSMQTYLMSA